MEISLEKMVPATFPLLGFAREQVQLIGSIKTIMVKFLLVDRPSAYNAILGRTALNDLKVVTSTSHWKIKFLTKKGIGEVKREQGVAHQYYNVTMKETPTQDNRREKSEQ
jgi:hypothetical protein